jgi:5,10-methenyltetrahydromethanopterin hydrogenase
MQEGLKDTAEKKVAEIADTVTLVIKKIQALAEEVKTAIEDRATLKIAKVAEDIRLLENESLPRLGVVTNHLCRIEELLDQKSYSEVIDAYYKERPDDIFNELQVTVKNLAKEIKDVKTALRTDTDKRVT